MQTAPERMNKSATCKPIVRILTGRNLGLFRRQLLTLSSVYQRSMTDEQLEQNRRCPFGGGCRDCPCGGNCSYQRSYYREALRPVIRLEAQS